MEAIQSCHLPSSENKIDIGGLSSALQFGISAAGTDAGISFLNERRHPMATSAQLTFLAHLPVAAGTIGGISSLNERRHPMKPECEQVHHGNVVEELQPSQLVWQHRLHCWKNEENRASVCKASVELENLPHCDKVLEWVFETEGSVQVVAIHDHMRD